MAYSNINVVNFHMINSLEHQSAEYIRKIESINPNSPLQFVPLHFSNYFPPCFTEGVPSENEKNNETDTSIQTQDSYAIMQILSQAQYRAFNTVSHQSLKRYQRLKAKYSELAGLRTTETSTNSNDTRSKVESISDFNSSTSTMSNEQTKLCKHKRSSKTNQQSGDALAQIENSLEMLEALISRSQILNRGGNQEGN